MLRLISLQASKGTPPEIQHLAERQAPGDDSWVPTPYEYDEQAYMAKWRGIPNKAGTGFITDNPLKVDFGTSFAAGTSEYYGCTVMYIVSRNTIDMAHFPEEVGGSCPLHSEPLTESQIIPWLGNTS